MPVSWDTVSDLKLLIRCIDPATKPNWDNVAGDMGTGYTAEACRQRFGKLKRTAMENPTAAADAAAASPAKRGRGKKAPDGESPTKKTKKNGKAAGTVKNGDVKDENNDVKAEKTEEKPMKMEDTDTA